MLDQQIQNYKIISLLGEGGMANVYLAYDSKFESEVAIKVLKDEFVRNKEVRKRFIDEAKILYKISNVNIVNVTDLIDAGDIVAFVMEYLDGQTVDQFVKQKAFSFFEINSIFNQMVSAIEYVHSVGLIHRDIKPSNFIISTDGKLKLFDFGIAKNVGFQLKDPNHTIVGQQIGTPSFMSPEQIENNCEITKQSDIYSLGVTLWYMVEGKSPYKLKSISGSVLKNKIVSELLPLTLTFWDDIIQNATKKKPEFRFIDKVKLNEAKDIDDTILDTDLKKKIISKKNKFFIFFSTLFIIILTLVISKSSLFIYFLNKDDKINKKVQYVLFSEINLMSKPFNSSKSLLKIPQADSVLILGDSAYSFEDGYNYKWKKCKYIDSEGWVSTEIDGQKNLGNKDLAEEFKILMANIPNGSYEYHDLKTIFFHGLIDFLKEKGLNRKYSFAQNQHNNKFQTIQKFNFRNNNRVYDCRILLNPINEYDYPLYIVLKLDVAKNKIFVKEIYGWKMIRKVKFFKVYNNDNYVDLYDVNEKYIGIHSEGEIEKL